MRKNCKRRDAEGLRTQKSLGGDKGALLYGVEGAAP